MEHTCASCAYGAANDERSVICHRYPPTIVSAVGPNITSFFPILANTAWCGEWKDKGFVRTDVQ